MKTVRSMFSNLWGQKPPEVSHDKKVNLMVTLWPDFSHFAKFANDKRLSGIRLNSAKITNDQLEKDLKLLPTFGSTVPLYFDAKGRQPRIIWVDMANKKNLVLRLNHPISIKTPVRVLFKAGADSAVLDYLEDGGKLLVFRGGPAYMVEPGESIHILDSDFSILGPIFTDEEKLKLEKVRKSGFKNYFLSYVESKQDLDEFYELVGRDSEVKLKIENQRGLYFVANSFKKESNVSLVTALGDLYIELEWPHKVLDALKLIISKDSDACVGSRMFLSVANKMRNARLVDAIKLLRSNDVSSFDPGKVIEKNLLSSINRDIPSCADMCQVAWFKEIGYRNMMLCDELCLYEDLLDIAVDAFDAFRANR